MGELPDDELEPSPSLSSSDPPGREETSTASTLEKENVFEKSCNSGPETQTGKLFAALVTCQLALSIAWGKLCAVSACGVCLTLVVFRFCTVELVHITGEKTPVRLIPGLPQGCRLSKILFIMFIDKISIK